MKIIAISIIIVIFIGLMIMVCAPMSKKEQEKYDKEEFVKKIIENLADKSILNDLEAFTQKVDELFIQYQNNVNEAIKQINKV
jgi:maltodextrin utilization protein YvdJ